MNHEGHEVTQRIECYMDFLRVPSCPLWLNPDTIFCLGNYCEFTIPVFAAGNTVWLWRGCRRFSSRTTGGGDFLWYPGTARHNLWTRIAGHLRAQAM